VKTLILSRSGYPPAVFHLAVIALACSKALANLQSAIAQFCLGALFTQLRIVLVHGILLCSSCCGLSTALAKSTVTGTGAAEPHALPDSSKLTIRIPAPSTICETGPVAEDEPNPNEETAPEQHTFCPIKYHDHVVEIMERHFCVHPLIPGYSALTPKGIKAWAVKQMYDFCVLYELPNLWAYLWENWYQRGRWELWACSRCPTEIPRLKTTMLVEGQ
jgi:hypothetical protein